MPRNARMFAFTLVAAGSLTVVCALLLWSSASPGGFALCLMLAVLGAMFKAPVPGIVGTISPSAVPILLAAAGMSGPEAVVIAAAAGMVQCLWRAKQRPSVLQVAFNGANFAISAALAHVISHRIASPGLAVFMSAAVVFQLVDTLAVATILSLLQRASVRAFWRYCHLWSFPFMLVSGILAALWPRTVPSNVSATVLCAIVLYLMRTCYQEIAARANARAPV